MEYGERQQKRRFVVLTAIFSGTIGVLTLYLFWLQIVKGGEFTQRARDVSERETPLTAQRGEIFDRQGDDPAGVQRGLFLRGRVAGRGALLAAARPLRPSLPGAGPCPSQDIEQKVPPKTWRQFQPIEVKGGVTLQSIAAIAERLEDFQGVSWHNKPIRSYVESGTLAHVIGYVGDITRDELQVLYNKSYAPGTSLGKSGVEKQYDDILRGQGREALPHRGREGKGRHGRGGEDRAADARAERRAHDRPQDPEARRAGAGTAQRVRRRAQALHGGDPRAGELPDASTRTASSPRTGLAYFTKLTLDPSSPFIDRAIQSAYPPGSTFKVIMTTGIVDDGTIPITQAVLCTGKLEFGDRVFNCWLKTGHGYEDLFGGLAQSCDVYFWTMGNRLGPDKILAYARDFGVGSLTGIDLPGETAGSSRPRSGRKR